MQHPIKKLTVRIQESLDQLLNSRQHLEKMLRKLFSALDEKNIRTNVDVDSLIIEFHKAEQDVTELSRTAASLLEQSFELARTSALITSSLDLKIVIHEVMDTVIHMTSAERAYLMLQDSASGEMSIVAARNWERETLPSEDVVFSNSVINLAIEKRTPIVTANAFEDTRFQGSESIYSHVLRSVMCIPLLIREEIVGVLYADNPIQKGIFKQDNLPILQAFAQQTAIAIDNARLYRALEQANKQLNEANRLKSEFLGVISHELRTPYSSIGIAVQVFPRYGLDNLKPEQQKVWQELVSGIESAQQLTNNLVNYAGLLSKQGQLQLRRVALTELIHEMVGQCRARADMRGIKLAVEVPENLVLSAGDPDRIGEAIWHMLQNAIQYNKRDGQVFVRAHRIDANLLIEVEDTGIGIAQEHQARIWEAFEQITDSLKRGVEGLGLGLALVRYVAVAHGGSVTLKSEPGKGSTFGLILPLSPTRITPQF